MSTITRFSRRHVRALSVAGVAVLALGGGGIAYATTTSGGIEHPSTPAVAAPPATTSTTAPAGAAGRGKGRHHGVRGTVTAISGDHWTVTTAKGQALTVIVNAQTTYGTKAAPSSAGAFPVGSRVAVVGPRRGTTVTATRISMPKAKPPTPAS